MRSFADGVAGTNAGPSVSFSGDERFGGSFRTLPDVGRSERPLGDDLNTGMLDAAVDSLRRRGVVLWLVMVTSSGLFDSD